MKCGKAPRKTGKGGCSRPVMSKNVRPLVKAECPRSDRSHAAREQPQILRLRDSRKRNKARKERRKKGRAVMMVMMIQSSSKHRSQGRLDEGPRQLRRTGSCFCSRKTVID